MLVFLTLNGYEVEYTQKELSDLILDVERSTTAAKIGKYFGTRFDAKAMKMLVALQRIKYNLQSDQ